MSRIDLLDMTNAIFLQPFDTESVGAGTVAVIFATI
jgi:hypothetical protein